MRNGEKGGFWMENRCDFCEHENGSHYCLHCSLGNPCLGCVDYDLERHLCLSNGACGSSKQDE